MKPGKYTILFSFLFLSFGFAQSQQTDWPKLFKTSSGSEIRLYEPQPETYSGNVLKIRSAVSLRKKDKADPVFGVLWADITLRDGQNNSLTWQNFALTDIKFPGETSQSDLDELTSVIEKEIPGLNIHVSRDELNAKINAAAKEENLSSAINTNPPKIIYSTKPAVLVLVDGNPEFEKNTEWGVEQVVNTPFTIVKSSDRQFYLYGEKNWYAARAITGPWVMINKVPSSLSKMEKDVRASDTSTINRQINGPAEIIVSTEPAELIQSDGEPNFTSIPGTDLLYMTNTGNDIFMDVNSQQYYVLMSGRWYKAPNLASTWTYMASTDLPKDFSKIPEDSPKGIVLTSVANTSAANESVAEAQIPQTAKVDRKNAKASVTYDGEPQFEDIEGTNLRYAVNTNGPVLNQDRTYYYVENGVWFESYNASGPWTVATQRPDEVQNIPPSYPVYNVKYVYIYDATPDYVYMGYTPGYLGTYIYGPTTVYGTGFHYRPWRGRYYFPRPSTWGFNMRYDPWYGWSFGLNIFPGWFFPETHYYNRGYNMGGCWGPPVYRPPYYGYYHDNYRQNRGYSNRGRYYQNNNVYQYRRDVVTYNRPVYNTVYNNYYNANSARPANRGGNVSGVQRPSRQQNTTQPTAGNNGVNRSGRLSQRVNEQRVYTPASRGNIDRRPVTATTGNTGTNGRTIQERVANERVTNPGNTGVNRTPIAQNPVSRPGNLPDRNAAQPATRPGNTDVNRNPLSGNTEQPQRIPQRVDQQVDQRIDQRVSPATREIVRDPVGNQDARRERSPQRIDQRANSPLNNENNRTPVIQQRSLPERAANQRVYEPANNNRSIERAPSRQSQPRFDAAPRNAPSGSNERMRSERPSINRSPAGNGGGNASQPQRPSRGRE